MLAFDLAGLGQLLSGVGTLAVAVVALRTKRAVADVDTHVSAAHEELHEVNRAVNTKPPDQQTISEQVADIAARLPAQDEAAAKVIRDDQGKGV